MGLELHAPRGPLMPRPEHKDTRQTSALAGAEDRLADYRSKRDPARTVEPFSARRPGPENTPGTRRGRFVVHHHGARRDHFDLRLEIGRALESFAVPKGPSLDPAHKRLAVQTEPHPLEYLDFEDVIPAGGYGAGPMIAWDVGTVTYPEATAEEGLQSGKVDFDLFGYKLKGRFALIATGRRNTDRSPAEWLLVKKPDAFARPDSDVTSEQPFSVLSGMTIKELLNREETAGQLRAQALDMGAFSETSSSLFPLPPAFEPMLCSTEPVALDCEEYLYELKLDGFRVLAIKDDARVILRYRRGRHCTESFPEIARSVRALAPRRIILDGEVASFDEHGRPSFELLASRLRGVGNTPRGFLDPPVTYAAFDMLALDDVALLELPLLDRKRLLLQLLRGPGHLRALDHLEGTGKALWDLCEEHGLEGLVAKRRTSRYRPGVRSNDWVKIKRQSDDEFVVASIIGGRGARQRLGALEVASYRGRELVLRGKVGTGLSEVLIDELLARLTPHLAAEPPYAAQPPPEAGTRRFVRPEVVVTVRHLGWTNEGRLRFPIFVGIREDVRPEDCRAAPDDDREESLAREALAAGEEARSVIPRGVLSNPDKVFWPEHGYTKRDLLDYYLAVADALLPFLKGRPVLLVRYPDGIEGKSFFQWNPPRDAEQHVRAMRFRDGEQERKSAFLLDDENALAYIVNLGCIPLHVLSYRETTREECDFLTIDFDLGGQPFSHAVLLARSLAEVLRDIDLPGFPKTSGQTGLHVLVPLGPGVSFDAAKMLAEILGLLLVTRHPDVATMERIVSKRGPRVYVDTGQTGRSRAIVAPYSVRAAPAATVSTPLEWDELHAALDARRFTIKSVPRRLSEEGDPLRGLLDARPNLASAMHRLEGLLRDARLPSERDTHRQKHLRPR